MQKEMIEKKIHPSLHPIAEKVLENRRLSREEGLFLYNTPHISSLQQLADMERKRKAGDEVLYTSTLHLYPTNICEIACPMCCFYAKPGAKNSWKYSTEELCEKIKPYLPKGIAEIHIVGGMYKEFDIFYYIELFQRIRKLDPNIHIKALTAVEIDFLAKLNSLSIEKTLALLIDAGLDFIPGGGAEILDDSIRKILAPKKTKSERFLEIHKTAHQMGLKSNITMLFNHIETVEDILTHLEKIRTLQDETSGFTTFVPLKYLAVRNSLASFTREKKDLKRVFALSRLMLDNVKNIKVLWNYLGLKTAKEILLYGGNDLGSTAIEEQVAAGKEQMNEEEMKLTISSIGRIPKKVERFCICSVSGS